MLPNWLKQEPDSEGNFTALENNSLLTASSLTDAPDLEREDKSQEGGTEYVMKHKKKKKGVEEKEEELVITLWVTHLSS